MIFEEGPAFMKGKMMGMLRENYFTYKDYTDLCDKYAETDTREINYQNRVIIPFLESVLRNRDVEVVDVSTLFCRGKRNSMVHDNSQYAIPKVATPDLLLTRNWHFDNQNNVVDYFCAIEIKSPFSREAIYNRERSQYVKHVRDELSAYHKIHKKVILTDCFRWEFYENGELIDTCNLIDENGMWKQIQINEEFPCVVEPINWRNTKKYILQFTENEKNRATSIL